ncbi:VOC family protein [Streptomyces misionensis]|uniref:VOC family protein n=1 Tax=Streptomyces misionensis TaxID=67331 RepID=A0A5C6JWZ0_9ACTN|nr:VOC family protein [Streptomyces misionensis]TWV52736.1 VOC family protein [Streptomyces misionensis]
MSAPLAASAQATALLRRLGAARIAHPGGTLLVHLQRVRELLATWGARPALQLAGLCHACYGTDGFPTALLPPDRRTELAAVIGAEAEAIVHLYASCDRGDGFFIGFQRVDDYRPPRWPGQTVPQQLHLCFEVADLDEAEARLLELGAGKPDHQPHDAARARVLTDPAGHPFCICRG